VYPTFSDILNDLFGINIPLPIQTFGLFMGIAFIAAAYFWGREFEVAARKANLKLIQLPSDNKSTNKVIDYALNLALWFVLAFKISYIIFHYSEFVASPPDLILSTKGNLIVGIIAIIAFVIYQKKSSANEENNTTQNVEIAPKAFVSNMTMVAAFTGILGAKLFHNLENLDEFAADPMGALLSFSGLTWYGGLILATVSLYYYSKKYKVPFIILVDTSVLPLLIGYALGRMGCQLSGDGDWGIVNLAPKPNMLAFIPDWMWSYQYPHNVINDGIAIPGCLGPHCMQLPQPVYPTPLYESMMSFAAFGFFWMIRKRVVMPGLLFAYYLIFNGAERFLIELIRVNTEYNIMGGVTQAQIISTLLFITGIAYAVRLKSKK
jgi:prolipoprotein diacylglyceryltransferase